MYQTEIDTRNRGGVTTDVAAENRELKRKNWELEQAIESLESDNSTCVSRRRYANDSKTAKLASVDSQSNAIISNLS